MFHRILFRPTRPELLLLGCVLAVAPLTASTVYTDRTLWESSTSALTNIDYEGLAGDYGNSSGLTSNSVQFVGIVPSSSGYQLWAVDGTVYSDHDYGSGTVLKGPAFSLADPGRGIYIYLPTGVTSVGMDVASYWTFGENFAIVINPGGPNEEQYTGTTPLSQTTTFFGLTAAVPITQVNFLLTSGISATYPILDNFAYGSAGGGGGGPAQTPEAATMLLVGTGLILVFRLRHRSKLWSRPPAA